MALTGAALVAAILALPPGQWLDVPGSAMSVVQSNACTDPVITAAYKQILTPIQPACGPQHVTDYSGGAYDPVGHREIVFGGGHAGYDGNELYAFSIDNASWARLTDPAPPELDRLWNNTTKTYQTVSPPWIAPGFPPLPISVHTYDQVVYLPDQNALFEAGGSTYSATGYASNATWMFNLAATDYTGWTQMQSMPGSVSGLFEFNMLTDWDPISHQVIMRGYDKVGAFDPATNTWTVFKGFLPTRTLNQSGALDTKRRLLVAVGHGSAQVYPVATTGQIGQPTNLGAIGDTTIQNCQGPGVEYDPVADRIVAWCGGGNVYTLDMDARVWTEQIGVGSTVPGPALAAGTYGRFAYMPEYDTFIVVNSTTSDVFIYRLSP